jgi:hypothetical protein
MYESLKEDQSVEYRNDIAGGIDDNPKAIPASEIGEIE